MTPHDAMLSRLEHLLGLDRATAARVTEEVFDALDQTVDEYIVRRHAALQRRGLRGPEIYRSLAAELSAWRFRAVPLTERQIRRRIYGG